MQKRFCIFSSFHKSCSVIGRNTAVVDFLINSAQHEQNAIISRCHAKVVRNEANVHEIIDSSRNGIFINDIKMTGKFRTFLGGWFDFLVVEFFVSKS